MPLHRDGGFARDELAVPAAQQGSRHWTCEEVPLHLGRPKPAHLVERIRRFYPLDDRLDLKLLRESEGGTDDRLAAAGKITDENSVDFYAVDRESAQIRQRGITRAEIVDGDADSAP